MADGEKRVTPSSVWYSTASRREKKRFRKFVRIARAMADDHRLQYPGHMVWTHFRYPMDFHLECHTCPGFSWAQPKDA